MYIFLYVYLNLLLYMMKCNNLFLSKNNWVGKLELNFSLKEGRSILNHNIHTGPFLVQKSFYPQDDQMTPHVYLLHPPGGLVGGDKLMLSVRLEPNSKALLTTPSSSKFYRSNGEYIFQESFFKLEENSILEWIPQSNIFFPKTKAKIKTIFILEQGARIITLDMLCFQNLNFKNFTDPEELDIFVNFALPHSVGFRDRFRINECNCIDNVLHGFKISAVFFASPADESILKKIRKLIKSIKGVQIGGVTLLDELLVARLLGNDNQKLKELLCQMWDVARYSIIGKKVIIPRIWFT